MATMRQYPYGNFNYVVSLGGETGNGDTVVGGFSDVQGINTEVTYAEYRAGNFKTNTVSKLPNVHKQGTLTLKRGMMGTLDLWNWLKAVRDGKYQPRIVTVSLQDEEHNTVMTFKLNNAQPQKWTAPNLAGKGGTDVAMEEFVLVYEDMDVE